MVKEFWSNLGGKLGVGMIGAGFLLVFLGWNGAASSDRVPSQFPYLISGGVGGLCFVVIGVGILVVQNQRADRAEMQATLRELIRAVDGSVEDVVEFSLPTPRPAVHAPGPSIDIVDESAEPDDVDKASEPDETAVVEAPGRDRAPRGRRSPLRARDS